MRSILGALLAGVSIGVSAQGNNCDCQQIVGACAASIVVVPTESTKGSYGADIKITSTSPMCAKVDYYVDGTPYFTILSQGNQGDDRVFGTQPITRKNVSDVSCKVCRQVGGNVAKPSDNEVKRVLGIGGRWHASACPGAPGWWGGGGPPRDVTMTLSANGGAVSGALSEHSSAYSYSASLTGTLVAGSARVSSSVGSTHEMSLSTDEQVLTDRWCNKDGGCAVCAMTRE